MSDKLTEAEAERYRATLAYRLVDVEPFNRLLAERKATAEAYGRALAFELGWGGLYHQCGNNGFELNGADLARVRTASLPTIVKALAAVIRAQEKKP